MSWQSSETLSFMFYTPRFAFFSWCSMVLRYDCGVKGYTSPSPTSLGSMISIAESTCQTLQQTAHVQNSSRDWNNTGIAAGTGSLAAGRRR